MTLVIAGTGHRPDKLGGYSVEVTMRLRDLAKAYLERVLSQAPGRDIQVISGMALGWDTGLALAALELELPLTAAVPFKGQECRWRLEQQDLYNRILEAASEVVIVCEGGYSAASMQRRNEWMVDRCDVLVALWNKSGGGTANCVRYANSRGVYIRNLWDSWVKFH